METVLFLKEEEAGLLTLSMGTLKSSITSLKNLPVAVSALFTWQSIEKQVILLILKI